MDEDEIFFFVFTLDKNQAKIIDLATNKQLFEDSVNADNVILGDYSPFTYEEKVRRFGTSFPRAITLFEEGDLYGSYSVKVFKNGTFEIQADTIKDGEDLEDRFGNLKGLTDESIEILCQFVVEDIVLFIRDKLGI